ncbi:MAG: hypothetical protein NTX88_00550 [Candidatus Atribacteria bacterium]|nr:hypothetical protein [Candidatus Atribacteria bacterium]
MTDDINTLLKRMEELEKGNRWLKVVVTLVLCVILAAFYVGAVKWNKEIVTEKLVIVDGKGNIQAELSGGSKGPFLTFYDSDGKVRMGIALAKGEPNMVFYGPDGKQRMGMSLLKGEPGIGFFDTDGKMRMEMGVNKGGDLVGLNFEDSDGKRRMGMGLMEGGEPRFELSDSNEKPKMIMNLLKGEPGLDFYDSKGNPIRHLP